MITSKKFSSSSSTQTARYKDEKALERMVDAHGFQWALDTLNGIATSRAFLASNAASKAPTAKKAKLLHREELFYDRLGLKLNAVGDAVYRAPIDVI